jgi:acetolactate synthase I/III small subunit
MGSEAGRPAAGLSGAPRDALSSTKETTVHDRHTISVLVENKPGVLSRVAGMFARRGYNIHSLAVGPTEDIAISRLTVVVGAEAVQLEQITKQLNKLVNVLKIQELEQGDTVERELLLLKVAADPATRSQVIELADVFRAKIVDVDHDSITIEAAGSPDKLEAMVELVTPFGIRELVRSGTIALGRGARSITDGSKLRMQRVV